MRAIGIGEIGVILVVALLVFGPDRLPTMVRQAASFVNDLRRMVANARRDLSASVGDLGIDENDIKTLTDLRNPKSFIRQKVLDGVDLQDLGLDDVKDATARRTGTNTRTRAGQNGSRAQRPPARKRPAPKPAPAPAAAQTPPVDTPSGARFDPDAT